MKKLLGCTFAVTFALVVAPFLFLVMFTGCPVDRFMPTVEMDDDCAELVLQKESGLAGEEIPMELNLAIDSEKYKSALVSLIIEKKSNEDFEPCHSFSLGGEDSELWKVYNSADCMAERTFENALIGNCTSKISLIFSQQGVYRITLWIQAYDKCQSTITGSDGTLLKTYTVTVSEGLQ